MGLLPGVRKAPGRAKLALLMDFNEIWEKGTVTKSVVKYVLLTLFRKNV